MLLERLSLTDKGQTLREMVILGPNGLFRVLIRIKFQHLELNVSLITPHYQ